MDTALGSSCGAWVMAAGSCFHEGPLGSAATATGGARATVVVAAGLFGWV